MKTCHKCKETKPFSDFHADKNRSNGLTGKCKACKASYNAAKRLADPEFYKYKALYYRYSISKDRYLEMTANGCESCGSFKSLHVDHDHNCCPYEEGKRDGKTCGKCVRGILCKRCNTAEGLVGSIETAEKLLGYMKRFA
jgi:hypothetical protein